jgi:hypothetical protein
MSSSVVVPLDLVDASNKEQESLLATKPVGHGGHHTKENKNMRKKMTRSKWQKTSKVIVTMKKEELAKERIDIVLEEAYATPFKYVIHPFSKYRRFSPSFHLIFCLTHPT